MPGRLKSLSEMWVSLPARSTMTRVPARSLMTEFPASVAMARSTTISPGGYR
jgi:hypothetical protein